MKTRIVISLSCLLLLLLISLKDAYPAIAQEGGFEESFEDTSLTGWEHSPQTAVVDGLLQVRPGGFAARFGDWSDITLIIKIRLSGPGRAGIAYYSREAGQYILLLGGNSISLFRENDHSRNPLGNAPVQIHQEVWLNLKIVVSGDQHQIYLDDTLVLTVTDAEPLQSGGIILTQEGEANVEYDDLTVKSSIVGMLPAEQGAPPPANETGNSPVNLQYPNPTSAPVSDGFIDEFFASQASVLDLRTFLINLALSVICAYVLGLVYIHWGSSLSNRRKFAANFLLMTITTTFIILVVRSSVALSLGLVGALSIVRFRTAVKEPEELAYLFVAIGIGIGLGDNQRLVTLLALAAIIAIIALRQLFQKPDADVNLHLAIVSREEGKVELENIIQALQPHVSKLKLLRLDETKDMLEAGFLVEFVRGSDLGQAKAALRALSPSLEITFIDNQGLW